MKKSLIIILTAMFMFTLSSCAEKAKSDDNENTNSEKISSQETTNTETTIAVNSELQLDYSDVTDDFTLSINMLSEPPPKDFDYQLHSDGVKTIYVDNSNGKEKYAVINLNGAKCEIRLIKVHTDDETNFYYDDLVQGLGWWNWKNYNISYPVSVSDGVCYDAVSIMRIRENDENTVYSYLLTTDGAKKIAVQNRPNDEYTTDETDTIPLKLWFYNDNDGHWNGEENFSFITVNIPKENFLEEASKAMYLHQGISVHKLWYEGNRLYADLTFSEMSRMDYGSASGHNLTQQLMRTLAGFPDVTEFEIWGAGEKNPCSDHFSFDGYYTVEGDLMEDIKHAETETELPITIAEAMDNNTVNTQMPDIVFIMSHNYVDTNICGYFITNNGEIKSYDYNKDNPDDTYDIMDIYKKLKKDGAETEYANIETDKLEEYYDLFQSIKPTNKIVPQSSTNVYPDVEEGYYNFYGMTSNSSIIHIGVYGDTWETCTDDNANELIKILRKIFQNY